ncbi:M20 family metallopeptidase [Alteribacter natronophilus]|uniref:M20 family metallopeptidase n=1 Tax=Alteribacter natronophilus TaxID=2583810 RepID=UPI00110D984F|nr:M20 family metallopeptidase [Alteribacter natronophilus]TMW73460.1 M20 family metallopeptidase [Alteribacter natronophilus]
MNKDRVLTKLEEIKEQLFEISQYIGNNPELGNEEFKACAALAEILEESGFTVKTGICGQPTAFEAVYDSGQPGPSIGFMSEYDALPGLGHGCGHNLIGTMGAAAGISLKEAASVTGGKVYVYGTPAEETRGVKVTMAEDGIFDHLDAALMCHPGSHYRKSGSSLAMDALQFTFKGKTAHAAASPEKGINALDSVIQTFNSINALREHTTPDVRIHGIIPEGGKAANVVPDLAIAQFYVRAATRTAVNEVAEKVKNCARGAALASGTELDISYYEFSYDDMITNETLSASFTDSLMELGTDEGEIYEKTSGGSLDMGNVSQIVPSIHPYIKISGSPITGHTVEFRDAALSREGFEGMFRGACAMAVTGVKLLEDDSLLQTIQEEFKQAKESNER